MRNLSILATTVFALLLAGCQKPTEVRLTENATADLEIEGFNDADSSLDGAPVDTTALLPRDQHNYTGFATVSAVKSDWGTGPVQSTVFARVVIVNKAIRVPFQGRGLFFGRVLGAVRVNGDLMLWRLRIPGNLESGVEYIRGGILNHVPRRLYVFTADSIATPLAIESPGNLDVLAPVGGQRVSRTTDMELRWNGEGAISCIISIVRTEGTEHRITPVMHIRPRTNTGRAVLPGRVLSLLPRGVYVFTFVVSNRSENAILRYGRVLMQASSIYNVRVDLI